MSTLMDRIIDGRFVLIAEIGVNYYDIATQRGISNMDAAKLMCLEATNAGIHAVKFQSYKADTIASKYSPSYWDTSEEPTKSQYELFKKYDSFSKPEYEELADYCQSIGISFLSTPFDFESVDYLNPLMEVYKISSSDLTNLPFIEYIARKEKPIIMSVGASNGSEMQLAVETIRKVNNRPLILMHCVLEYPTPYLDANLSRITSLIDAFPDTIIGYSDHCKPDPCYDVIKCAYGLGAHVIEKHFTLDKTLKGNDHYHAMDVEDARNILSGITFIETIQGKGGLEYSESEVAARNNARRSIVASVDISEGSTITRDMVTFKRPGTGISPSQLSKVIGKISRVFIPADTLLAEDMME